MSALDKLIASTSNHWPTLTPKARAELAQLRATVAELQEHDCRTIEKCDVCGCSLICDVLDGDAEYSDPYCPICALDAQIATVAEQARQLEQARPFAEYVCDNEMSNEPIHKAAKIWLSANPAPQAAQERTK